MCAMSTKTNASQKEKEKKKQKKNKSTLKKTQKKRVRERDSKVQRIGKVLRRKEVFLWTMGGTSRDGRRRRKGTMPC